MTTGAVSRIVSNGADVDVCIFLMGCVSRILPGLAVARMGRARLYGATARLFEAQQACNDGAFVALLLDHTSSMLSVGQVWWLHRGDNDDEDQTYPESDHRRNWRKGNIVEIGEYEFGVELQASPRLMHGNMSFSMSKSISNQSLGSLVKDLQYVPLGARNVSSEQLLKQAHDGLRCIEWKHMKKDCLNDSSGNEVA